MIKLLNHAFIPFILIEFIQVFSFNIKFKQDSLNYKIDNKSITSFETNQNPQLSCKKLNKIKKIKEKYLKCNIKLELKTELK